MVGTVLPWTRTVRNGMKELISGVVLEKLPFLPQILARPRWLASYLLDGGLPPLPNVVIPGRGPMPLPDVVAALAESTVTWDDSKWIRELRRGPVVVNANPLSELITRVTSRAAPPWIQTG